MIINYPSSIAEQRAIASILTKVDESKEALESSIRATDRLKKSLMQNLLTRKVRVDVAKVNSILEDTNNG